MQARVTGHQRELERAGRNLRREFGRAFAGHRHLDQGVAPIEPGENFGEERFGVVVRDTESRGAPEAPAGERGDRARLDLDDLPRIVDQAFALGGELRTAPVFDEQGATELLLEPADMHGDGGLRLVDPLRRLGERAAIDDGEEGTKLVGVEHGNLSEISISYSTNIRWTDQ